MSGNDLLEADHQHLHPPANNCKITLFPNLKGAQKLKEGDPKGIQF